MPFNVQLESDSKSHYVNVLADSVLVKGPVATQNAGSSNRGIYYQVGGGGRNGDFADGFGPRLCDLMNQALVSAYDERFGAGSWQADNAAARGDRLTSFYVPIPRPLPVPRPAPPIPPVGDRIAGMVYSVGPIIHQGVIGDRDQYRQIYVDALDSVAAANRAAASNGRIEALRITMLSTGIYSAGLPAAQATALARDAATLILDALAAAAAGPAVADLPATILINTATPVSKEIDAFTYAAGQRKLAVTAAGFVLDAS
jgi:hypothetical protein